MAKSMTGYAKLDRVRDKYRVSCEIRSLNSKYFTTDLQIPSYLSAREKEIIELVQSVVKRGKVTVRIYVEFLTPIDAVRIDYGLAKSYYEALEKLVMQLGIPEPVNLENLLRFRELIRFELPQQQEEEIFSVVTTVLNETLELLDKDKVAEGSKLTEDLLKIIGQLFEFHKDALEISQETPVLLKEKIKQDIQRLLEDTVQLSEGLLENAVVLAVQKMDIREEIARLESHLHKARKLLVSNDSVGNHLDFVAQEMFREVNTILSKSQDQRIIDGALRAKVLISQFREQVQNIE
ncbi:MAG: YicC/YloC family endoribonuclease [Pseudothermotoga sp.]